MSSLKVSYFSLTNPVWAFSIKAYPFYSAIDYLHVFMCLKAIFSKAVRVSGIFSRHDTHTGTSEIQAYDNNSILAFPSGINIQYV